MKILLLWDHYDYYPLYFYKRHPDVAHLSYRQQQLSLLNDFYAWPSYLIPQFQQLGYEADVLIGNAYPLQAAWARENGCSYEKQTWRFAIIQEQIRRYRPDVLWLLGAEHYLGPFLREVKDACRYVIAWRATTWSPSTDWSDVDCVLTSYANLVQRFRQLGKHCELLLPCFDPGILPYLRAIDRDVNLSFVGSLNTVQFSRRLEMLDYLYKRVPLRIYSERPIWRRRPLPLTDFLSQVRFLPFFLRMRRSPAVYGLDMFQVMARSKMTLNVHERSSGELVGNIRMFEATGAETLLVTDAAPNLTQIFEPDKEVITYRNLEEALEKIKYYLANDEERKAIAHAGQQRTLQDHNSLLRAKEAATIFRRVLTGKATSRGAC